MSKKATIEVNMQGHQKIRSFLIRYLIDWDAIMGHPMVHHLDIRMNVKHNKVTIQPRGKRRYDLNMFDRVTETPVMLATATFTEDYDSPYA